MSSISIVGTNDYAFVRQSIKELLAGLPSATYVLGFAGKFGMQLPGFALSDSYVFDLYWEVIRHGSVDATPNVTVLKWTSEDSNYWDAVKLDNQHSVFITFAEIQDDPSKISIQWRYKARTSKPYIYDLSKNDAGKYDAFFMILSPYKNFKVHRLTFLSSIGYINKFIDDQREAKESHSLEFKECIIKCDKKVRIMFLPCGHSDYCKGCYEQMALGCPSASKECSSCKTQIEKRVQLKKPPKSCKLCPTSIDCHRIDSVLIPCNCILGCYKSAQKLFQPYEQELQTCVECRREVEFVAKVFLQEPRQ